MIGGLNSVRVRGPRIRIRYAQSKGPAAVAAGEGLSGLSGLRHRHRSVVRGLEPAAVSALRLLRPHTHLPAPCVLDYDFDCVGISC